MHWLFDGSDEAPDARGLGVLPGRCRRLDAGGLKVPHVGWNELEPGPASRLLDSVERGAQVYFTHSYVAPVVDDTTATTRHGAAIFSSVVERGRVAGVQFHPEKSGAVGLRLLRNWVDAL
jgi:glutamine amidotransferase